MKIAVISMIISKLLFQLTSGTNPSIKQHWRLHRLFSSNSIITPPSVEQKDYGTGDVLMSGLSEKQDISVRVVSCREIVQEAILKTDMSQVSSRALGELLSCCLMMGAGLKDQESLQINIVGVGGVRNLMAITDSALKIRGMVGVPRYSFKGNSTFERNTLDLVGGEGQIQVVRNHPDYKRPSNGITVLRQSSIPFNLGLYLAESEQRAAAMIADVKIDGNLCRNAIGVLVETLPGADPDNVEIAIRNLERIEAKGLSSYLIRTEEERSLQSGMFRDFDSCLQNILDDSLLDLGTSLQWSKTPSYACNCGLEKVWRALRLLPKTDVIELIETQNSVEFKCEFCGQEYHVPKEEIEKEILSSS